MAWHTDPASLEKIDAPILGIFGAQDRGIPPGDVKQFEQPLQQRGKKEEINTYADAGDAFENPNDKEGTRDAWGKTVNFLANTLK